MTVDQFRSGEQGSAQANRPATTLMNRLADGEPYAISFGGQGAPWLATLSELVIDADLEHRIGKVVSAAECLVSPVADQIAIARPDGFHPLTWVRAHDAGEPVPSEVALADASLSLPGVLLSQLAAIDALAKQGLDTAAVPPTDVVGHSQGVLAIEAIAADEQGAEAGPGVVLAIAELIGAAGTIIARRRGLAATVDGTPMLAIGSISPSASTRCSRSTGRRCPPASWPSHLSSRSTTAATPSSSRAHPATSPPSKRCASASPPPRPTSASAS